MKKGLGKLFEPTTLQQTNTLYVDKHMCVIIAIHVRSKPREDSDDEDNARLDPQEALYNIADR